MAESAEQRRNAPFQTAAAILYMQWLTSVTVMSRAAQPLIRRVVAEYRFEMQVGVELCLILSDFGRHCLHHWMYLFGVLSPQKDLSTARRDRRNCVIQPIAAAACDESCRLDGQRVS